MYYHSIKKSFNTEWTCLYLWALRRKSNRSNWKYLHNILLSWISGDNSFYIQGLLSKNLWRDTDFWSLEWVLLTRWLLPSHSQEDFSLFCRSTAESPPPESVTRSWPMVTSKSVWLKSSWKTSRNFSWSSRETEHWRRKSSSFRKISKVFLFLCFCCNVVHVPCSNLLMKSRCDNCQMTFSIQNVYVL